MRKMSNVKKAAILASVLGGCVFAGSAMAANLLVTVPSNYGSSNMAVITGSRVTDRIDSEPNRAVMTSLNRDPAAYSFVMDGKNKFILRQYTYDTIDLLPMILVDADTDWPKDGYISGTISKGANPHAAAGHNGYVYTGDYDLGTIAVAKVTNNALVEDVSKTRYLLEDINKYCEGDLDVSEGAWTHGESLLVKGNQLFAVVSVNATGGNTSYSSGYLLQYDIQADGSLKFVSFTRTGRNTDTVKLNSYNNLLINTAIGGMQNYGYGNNGSNVTIGVLNGGKLNDKNEVNASIVPENIKKFKLDFRDICVWPNGTAYILAYNLDGSGRGGSTFNIYKTTVANLNSTTPKDWEIVVQDKTDGGGNTGVKTGWFNKIFAEYYTKRLWGEFGDNIVVYLDGDNNPSYTWSAYNLAGNSDYHTFNSVTQLAGDDVVGGLALLTKSREEGLTTPSATTSTIININANVKKADYQNRITGTTNDTIYSNITPDNSNYTFEGDKTISLNELAWKTQADLSNNILAAVYAHDGNDITVNAGSNTLQLQVQNSIATPVGVYAGNGKNVTINADKLNIITIGAVDGNSLNNAIMNDAGKSAASKITVNGDVNISMSGGYGGNGVAIQKTDRWGEASYASDVANTITINGNLTVKGTDSETWGIPINADNVLSRFNNAGILTQVENSRVDVSGTADMDVYGNGITTNAKNSTVSVGGGEINVPKGMNYGYYTLGAYQGTINVNTGKDGTAAGNNSVKLGGDIFALPTGTVNVALTTGDSYLRGIVDNGGTVNMWLQNGASWINQANNTRYAQDNEDVGSNGASHISKLTGGSKDAAGVIFQKSGSKDITIDKYSGNTMVIYEHDNNNPENILGGNFTVKTAENGSAVVLRTDSSGVNTSSEATVNKVLDALANKLYYTDYVSGSRNLDGQVQIAEGLTAASAAQYIGNIEYSSTSGQGRLGEKITTQLEVPKGDNVENNKNFLVENDSWHGNNSGDKVNLTLKDKASWTGDNKGEGLNVTLNTSSWEGNNEGGAAVIELKNKSNWSGDNSGNNANIVIDDSTWNGENIGKDAIITVRNNGSWNKDVKINNTKLTVDSASYNGHIVSDSNTINVQNSAQWSGNVNGKNNIITIQEAKWSGNNSGDSSTIDLLNAKWNGNSFGKDTKVAINSGSVWEGYNSGAGFDLKMASGSTWVITADSVVENLSSNLGRAGGTNPTIDMTNCAANATIGNYNGNFTLLYKHDYTNPSQLQGGSFTINKAMDGSTITLLTDSSGIKLNDEDSVNDTLNALANKLYYQEAIDGKQNLSGSVKIVESLTAPEISKQAGSIIYNSTNGQGMLDVNSVAPGFTYPKMQDKFVFNTTLTGDYKMDKEYRQHGVLKADNNMYEFPLDPSNSSLNEKTTIVPENGNAISVNQDTTITMGRSYDLYLNAQKAPNIIVNNAKLNIFAGTVYTGRDEILTYDYKTRNEYQPGVIVNNGSLKIEGNLAAYGKVDDVEPVITINGKDSSVEITKSLSIAAGRVVQYGDKEDFSNKAEVAVLADGGKLLVKSGVNISGSLHATNEGNIELRSRDGMTVMGDLIADKNAKIKLVSNQGNIYNVDLDSNVSTDATGEVILDFTNSGLLKNKWEGDNNGNTQLVMGNGEWRGNNNGNITASLVNSSTWTGTNTGNNATISLTDSSWSGDNSGAGLSLTADNSKWNGSTNTAGSAVLTNGSIWTGASTSADFGLTLNGSTWNNSGASSLKSFTATNGIVDMTNAAASVTIGSYSGDATVIYKHNSSDPGEVYGGNFTVNKAAANSKITMLTDNTGVDTTDEDKINEALDALAGKLFYLGAIGGAESNLNGTVKIAEGLTATSVAKQTAGIVYDKTTGQGSADHKTVTPGPVYPSEQDRTAFVTSITGEHLTDKEYRKAGVLSNTVDNNIYNFTKDATTITTDSSAITTAKDTTLKLNSHDMTITASSGDGIATTGGTLTVQDAGSLTVSGAKAINANNSKVDITAANATLNGDVTTNNTVTIKAAKAAKVNGVVSANGANAAVTIDSADTTIGSGITANGKGAKVTAKNIGKLNGNVATDADGSVELNFKEGASWSGDNAGNTAMSLSKGTWNGANTGKLNATLTNGTTWTGDSSGAGSTIKLDGSSWSGMNSGANANVTLTNGASWSKGNTADGVTVKADKATWTGANSGANTNITLTNATTWTGTNNGANATVSLTDSSWSGDNSGAGLSLTANNSKWNGSTNTAGSAVLTNGSIWTGASTSADFALTLNGSTWNNSGASSLKSFTATNGIVDMTNAAASVTIGSYSGDATVIYKHNSSNPAEVHGGNFTVNKAAANSKITMLTDNTGVDTTDEDKINEALDALAGKLFYLGAIGGAESNLNGTVKIAEGLTATSVAKQTAGIVYDKTTGQGSADHKTVTPGPVYPSEQDRTAFVTSITGEHLTDKEYRKAGVLSNTVDNNIYNFTKDATTITTDSSAITTAKDTTLKLNNHDLTITANSGDGIATTGATLTVQNAGSLTVSGAKAINANNSKVEITAVNATLNGDVSTNNVVNIKATKAAKINGVVSANGANAAVTIDSADTIIGSDITANGKGAKVTAKNLSKLNGNVATDADGSVELNFKEGAAWSGDNAGNTTMSLSNGSWNGANTGKLNATLTNGTTWTGDSSGAGSTIKLDASSWSGMNSGENANVTLNNGASWSKGNTADGVTVKADKSSWMGANGGANANITLGNASTWTGANNGANATVNLTDSSWSGDNSGAGLSLTANNSKWNGNANAAGSAVLTNGSIWTGASTSGNFSLTLNNSTWNNSGASSLKSFNATNGIVDMTNAAASVTIGSYSGDATVIYKHNSSNPAEVHGGNFTVNKAAANSKITMLTDNTGVDTTDEDKINEALDALAGKLFYLGAIGGAESNLNGTVKIAEGLTATSVAKQTAGIVYDKTTGQGSADHKTVTPGPVYPSEQDRTAFVTSITGEHLTDKEYRKAGVLSNTVDNNIYNFTKDATTITTDSSAITTAKDTTLKLNNHDLTITASSGDGIATTGGTLIVQDAGNFAVTGAKAINANNSKVDITAVNATLNGDVSTNNVVNIKATKAAKVNGAVSANGANSSVSINGGEATTVTGAVNADGANAAVTIDSADTIIGSDITANGKGAKVTAKNLSKLNGNVATDADGSVELNFKEGASWTGDNSGNTTMSLSKGTWNGANTGKLNATLTNGTTWTGDSSGTGSTIKLDASSWSGMNSGANANVTLTNGASWSKGNTADGVTVKADKSSWMGANGGANANITLGNASTWTGANNGANATVNLTDSSWSGDNSGANVTITANNSKWNGNANVAGSAVLTNGSIWTGASTSADFSLTLNGSTWNNSGASSLKSFTGTNGVVDMTNAAASVTIGSYSGDATVIYKHNSSNPAEVHGGNFTVNKAAANSKITMLTDNTGVDTTDEDKINEALDALAGKLFYLGAIGGAESNLNGTVKIAEGLTATSVAKQTAGIVYDKTTGQGSADHKTVTPGPVYPSEQDRTAFVTSITGEHLTDKEYRKAGVLSNTVDNNIYNFTKDATTITTDSSAVTTAKDTTLKLNNHDLMITANGGDGIATTGGTLTVQNAGSLTVSGAKAINANNSKVEITAVNATLNGDVSTNNVVNIKATKAAKINGVVSANGANAAVTIDSADTIIGSDITANGKGAKVTAKNLSKLNGNVATDADGSVELTFKEGASWTGDNSGNTTMSLSKGTWNGANTGKLNATLTNGTSWTGDSSGAGSTIKLDASTWNGANSGANADITLTNGASWSKGNTADGVTVKADKSTWTGANGGAKANITLSNSASWTGTNTGNNATISLTDSSWSGDNSGAGLSLTANNSKWNGSTNTAGSAILTNGSIWNGASTSADFSLTLNGSTWNNSGASSLKSFNATNGIVDMTNAAASVTIGSYSGDATVIYKHNSSNPAEVHGGNFTVNKAAANSKITMLTDRSGVDFSDEDSIANALNSLANKLYYTGYITGERNLTGYVKLAEGLTASSVVKQTGDIAYDKTTGQGSLKDGSVTPNVTYPEEQTKDNFTSQITGEWKQDKEYKLAGVLHTDNAVYDFSKDRSIITTAGTSVGAGRDLQLQLNNKSMSLNSGADAVKADAITIEFKNLDKLDIKAAGQALLAENGGKIILHNTGAVTADSAFVANGAGSGIKADGLTNITVGSGDAVKADAGSIELAGGTVKGDVTADNKGKISINAKNNAAGSILTDITGNVLATAGSSVDIGLGTADSKLTGDVSTAGDAVINIYADMGVWTGNADGDNVNLNLNSSKAQWNNIGNSKLRSLKGNGGIINQTDANAGNIDVGDYSGNVVVNYKHTADKDTASNTLNNIKFCGGSLNIDKAAEGSSITLRTDNSDNLSYTETDNIEKLFRELSKKLYYADAGSNPDNLSGHVEIAEGLTKVKVYGDINYGEHGQGNYKDGSIKRTDPEIIYGSSETAMMRGAKSAMASTALLWRSENSDMLQRMGDVRLANEESGLWARYYGGKNSFDAKNTKYSTSFNAYQLGYDKQLDNNKLFGAAVSYNKGKNTYEMGGHGDGKAVSLSVYGSWNSDKGHYADVIVKGGKLDNDYTVYNDMGHKLEGDYDTWGLSLSAEYGRRMQMQNGFYIDPSVQFTIGRIAGADYSAASDFLDSKGLKKDMYVSQDAFTSAIGRIGLGMGKTTDKAMFYTKFALAHEFSGDFTTTFAAENEPTSSTAVDFGGTWFEWQLGGSMKVNDNSYVYATFEKKFGGDTGSNDWRLDAGLRWSF